MINEISIHNYKSYHPTNATVIEIDTAKQATFIYGLNGAGKSAIGEAIHGCFINDATFAHCRVQTTGTGPFRHLVYNHAFVSRVIGESMQGIFTIGEVDTARQKEIDEKSAENKLLDADLTALRSRLSAARRQVEAQTTRGIDEVWRAHGTGKATKLADFLQGYGRDKNKFFDDLRKHVVDEETSLDTMSRLEQRWVDVSGTETSKNEPKVDFSDLADIEGDTIWAESVEVSSNSRLAALIAKLGNGDWVDQGRPYIQEDQCPFCQQDLPHDFHQELAQLLEGGRQLKIEKINNFVSGYSTKLELIQDRMRAVLDEPLTKTTDVELAWTKVESSMKSNLALMKAKQGKPGNMVVVEIIDCQPIIQALDALKEKIADFNQRILNRSTEKAQIRTMFYQVLCRDRKDAYSAHDAALAPLNEQLNDESENVARVERQIAANNVRLAELLRAQTGVDASVVAINDRLRDMGVTSFWIKKSEDEGHLYYLARQPDVTCSTLTLSEGEKTLISFLYFMELIKGSHDDAGVVDVEKTIVVIDDPISSLSQNFIYDIATVIQNQLIKPPETVSKVRQVIVLTHNLFFFHELVYQLSGSHLANAHKRCQMLRVHKNEYSGVVPLDPTSYMNDYDALWHVLRDARDRRAAAQVVPNTMRCILEQFFTFTTGGHDFNEALEKMAGVDTSHKFKALQRYLHRGSHKDGINGPPIDWSQYDVDYYLSKLRALLASVGHENHYLRKMGEAIQEAAA